MSQTTFGSRDAGPHQGQPVRLAGAALAQATAAVVMLHGRGATAEDILALAVDLGRPDLAYLAPQAAGHTWYPYSFLAPLEQNEPWLSSALARVGELLADLAAAGIPATSTVLLGFSQGACLALELARRQPRRYGGVVGLSGGLIGPSVRAGGGGTAGSSSGRAGADAASGPAGGGSSSGPPDGGLAGTPVFLGCSDHDPHVPAPRVEESARLLAQLGGSVTLRLYPDMGHTVNADEIQFVQLLLAGLPAR